MESLAEMAEHITLETLPEFFRRLHNRPLPHNAEYEILILKEAAEALGTTLWKIFLKYQDTIGEKLPNLTELAWQLSFPNFYNLNFLEPKMGTVFNFPEDRIQKKKRGRKPNKFRNLQNSEILNNVIRLQKSA
jgi:hypothetical protein